MAEAKRQAPTCLHVIVAVRRRVAIDVDRNGAAPLVALARNGVPAAAPLQANGFTEEVLALAGAVLQRAASWLIHECLRGSTMIRARHGELEVVKRAAVVAAGRRTALVRAFCPL